MIDHGISLIERRNAFEFIRDHAAELFEAATASVWRLRTGSMVNGRNLTASMIDSREFLAARRRPEVLIRTRQSVKFRFLLQPPGAADLGAPPLLRCFSGRHSSARATAVEGVAAAGPQKRAESRAPGRGPRSIAVNHNGKAPLPRRGTEITDLTLLWPCTITLPGNPST